MNEWFCVKQFQFFNSFPKKQYICRGTKKYEVHISIGTQSTGLVLKISEQRTIFILVTGRQYMLDPNPSNFYCSFYLNPNPSLSGQVTPNPRQQPIINSDFFCSTGTKCAHQKIRKNQKKSPNTHPAGLVPLERSIGTIFFYQNPIFCDRNSFWVRSSVIELYKSYLLLQTRNIEIFVSVECSSGTKSPNRH